MRTNKLFGSILLVLVTLVLAVPVAAQDGGDEEAAEDAIGEAVVAWDEAFSAGDLDQLLSFYANDIVAVPPGLPVREGKDAFRADFEPIFAANDTTHETDVIDIRIAGDTALELSRWTMTLDPVEGGDTIVQTGRRILVRERIDGEWKIVWAIWNTVENFPEE